MSGDKLTPLQRRILRELAGITPPWTLTGGGALAGVHLGHRETRDLDLFWRNRDELGVSDRGDACIVDLVAEPFGPIAAPDRAVIEGTTIQVDNRHELLASKLATLLERSETEEGCGVLGFDACVGAEGL